MNQFPTRTSSRVVAGIVEYMSIPIFVLAALGLLLTWRRWRSLLFIYLVILLTIAQCLYFYGSSRFRAPIEPMMVLLVAGVVCWVMQKKSCQVLATPPSSFAHDSHRDRADVARGR